MARPTHDEISSWEPEKQIAYWRDEAEKAVGQREAAKAEARREVEAAKAAAMSDDDRAELARLKDAEAKAEEERQRKDGEFEALKQAALQKQAEAEQRAADAERRYVTQLKSSAFANATDLFGREGRTVFRPDHAALIYGQYCDVQPGENGHDSGVVVKDLSGEVIRGADGRPAPFAEAMGQLIDSLPDKDSILRGSGKAGSGSTGGTRDAALPVDRAELARRADQGDPEALRAWRPPPGATRSGRGFQAFQPPTAKTG